KQKIANLHQYLFMESSPIPAKFALYKMGNIEQCIRLPLTWLTPEHQQVMDEALAKAGLL
ncbi:dihydrodipicolinate synthase family protein, partial [Xanthomonas citri pv. citri]